jgi:RNA recognition motif-containing protein
MSLTDDMRDGVEPGKLFVGGLSWSTTKESLIEYFKRYGEVTDATVMISHETRNPR